MVEKMMSFKSLLISLCLGLFVQNTASISMAEAEAAASNPFVQDWSASGNGCRGGQDKNGSAQLIVEKGNGGLENTYVLKLITRDLSLESPSPQVEKIERDEKNEKNEKSVAKETLSFGRECSLRVSLAPPAGKRIRNVTANSLAKVTKGPNFSGWVSSELGLGNQTVAAVRKNYSEKEDIRNRTEEFQLLPGRNEGMSVPVSKCGQPRLLAHDTIFAAQRQNFSDTVEMKLAGDYTIQITVDLEDCKT
jgi:hypothetical protein